MLGEQRAQVVLRVVARRELEDRLPGLLGEPDHRALREGRRPLDVPQDPGGLDARQLRRGGAVEVGRGVGVTLQEGRGHVLGHFALDRAGHDLRLVLSGRDQRDLAGLENRGDPHRDRLPRHVVLTEELGRGIHAGHRVERRQACAFVGRRARLVEADMPALPDPQHLEVDPPGVADGPFVRGAVLRQALPRHAAVGDVHVLGRDVDVRE